MSKMRKVFICSPYRGDVERNVENARKYCRNAIEQGLVPIAPHLYFPQFLDDDMEEQRDIGISAGIQLLRECDEMWVFGTPTDGMKREISEAMAVNKPVTYKTEG